MPVDIQREGTYELFVTTKDNRILVLDNKEWYAWVEGQQGEILVHSDSDHEKDRTLQRGRFYLVDFREDPTFKDIPHLFLEKNGRYQEVILPNGLPTEADYQKKVVRTDETLKKEELEDYLKNPAPAGPGEKRMDRPGGGSMANVTYHLRNIDFPAGRGEIVRQARRNDAPKAVLEQLDHLEDRTYENMAEVTQAVGKERASSKLPISDYDQLTVDEVEDRLDNLSPEELRTVRRHEREHKHRKTLMEALDGRLGE